MIELLPPSPPAEKASARQDQARKASTGDGAGDINVGLETRRDEGIVESEDTTFGQRYVGPEREVRSRKASVRI